MEDLATEPRSQEQWAREWAVTTLRSMGFFFILQGAATMVDPYELLGPGGSP